MSVEIIAGDTFSDVEHGPIKVALIHANGDVEVNDDLGFFAIFASTEALARISDGRWSAPTVGDIQAGGRRFDV